MMTREESHAWERENYDPMDYEYEYNQSEHEPRSEFDDFDPSPYDARGRRKMYLNF